MKLHQQFDLNIETLKVFKELPKAINEMPALVEELTKDLLEEGYIVIESSARYMGVPQSITIVKDFTGPFVLNFSSKVMEDFKALSKKLGVEKLFE